MPPKAEDKFYIIIPTKELYNTLVNMLKTLEEKTEEELDVESLVKDVDNSGECCNITYHSRYKKVICTTCGSSVYLT